MKCNDKMFNILFVQLIIWMKKIDEYNENVWIVNGIKCQRKLQSIMEFQHHS